MGKQDGRNVSAFGLVTVIYSVILFLLGIAGTLKSERNKFGLITVSCAAFLIVTSCMFALRLPEGFGIVSYFKGS
ncbi:MAG: hypothetical protein LBQ56_00960 [Synergistaceae bacterium]|nr:hypothetical protein [Synergistaceae bacterium]